VLLEEQRLKGGTMTLVVVDANNTVVASEPV